MKYIRTKDGKIFSVLVSDQVSKDEVAMDIIGFRIQTALKQNKCIANKDNILKIADTIEELCDRFFLVDTRNKLIQETVSTSLVLRTWQALVGEQPENVLLIFGVIMMSKGLIYVSQYDKNKKEMVLL